MKNKNTINYDLDKIKFSIDRATFERAVNLYETGKVTKFKHEGFGFSATVLGGSVYSVFVSAKKYDQGGCDCYLGQENILCKHMVAVAIYAALDGRSLSEDDKTIVDVPMSSNLLGTLNEKELIEVKKTISEALRYIKAYNGPSRTWSAYQSSLEEGCNRLSSIFSKLPVCEKSAQVILNTLLKLDTKLSRGGVDDSDGIVGGFIEEAVSVLEEYVKLDTNCAKAFEVLEGIETCFGWEERLITKKHL